jgi:hypothetical protein
MTVVALAKHTSGHVLGCKEGQNVCNTFNGLKAEFLLNNITIQFIPHRKHISAIRINRLTLFRGNSDCLL